MITVALLVAGMWLIASPYLLGFAWFAAAWWNAFIVGVCIVILALIRFSYPKRFEGLRWTALMLGAWMIASPYVANYADIGSATWNAIVAGAFIVFITMAAAVRRPEPATD